MARCARPLAYRRQPHVPQTTAGSNLSNALGGRGEVVVPGPESCRPVLARQATYAGEACGCCSPNYSEARLRGSCEAFFRHVAGNDVGADIDRSVDSIMSLSAAPAKGNSSVATSKSTWAWRPKRRSVSIFRSCPLEIKKRDCFLLPDPYGEISVAILNSSQAELLGRGLRHRASQPGLRSLVMSWLWMVVRKLSTVRPLPASHGAAVRDRAARHVGAAH